MRDSALLENIGNWLNAHFLNLWPAAIGLAATVPLVVILYFLKLKRKEQVVSSTLLWQRVLEDMRVNAPFQRLKTNLLLLLQLLILLAVALALSRPFIPGLSGERKSGFIFLVDCSASMSTRDCSGRTRLEAAKEAALREIERISGDRIAAVVSFGASPRIVCGFSSSSTELREAVESIRPTGGGTDLSSALAIADGMAGSLGRDASGAGGRSRCRLVVFSDAALPENRPVKPVSTKDVELRRFGVLSDNAGITSLEARRTPGGRSQVFVRVANFGEEPSVRDLRLFLGDHPNAADVKKVEIEPRKRRTVIFEVRAPAGAVPVRAELSAGDRMAMDDVAWAVLPPERKLQILAYSNDQYFVAKSLQNLPSDRFAVAVEGTGSLPGVGDPVPARWSGKDAVVFDRCVPGALPAAGGFLFIGPDGNLPIAGAKIGEETRNPRIIDWDRAHPLVRFTSLDGVLIGRGRTVKLGRGQTNLLESSKGPLIAAWQSDQLRVVGVGFDVYESNWPLRLSFPIFMANSVRWLSAASPKWAGAGIRCGDPIKLRAGFWRKAGGEGPVTVTVNRPDGKSDQVQVSRQEPRLYGRTDAPGLYRASGPGEKDAVFACAVLDEAESDNSAREAINFAVGDVRGAKWALAETDQGSSRSGREIWKYLAIFALGVMVLEWYIYNRRLWA